MTEDQNDLDAVQEYLEALRDFAGTEEIDDRDIALGILTPDYESQLAAIRGLLQRNYADEERATAKLLEMEADIRERHGPQVVDFWIDTWVDHLHEGVFIDAAHSMAAVGLVAPLIESLFDRAFRYLETEADAAHPPTADHPRWDYGDRWNCRFVWNGGRRSPGTAKGILQLADASGLREYLPEDLGSTLLALFAYRNKMAHCGLEWPKKDREEFANRIRSEGWTDFFSSAKKGESPWIFYLSREFVDHCLNTVSETIDGIGAYVRANIWKEGPLAEGEM